MSEKTLNSLISSFDHSDNELLVIVRYSDDAAEEALSIIELESILQEKFSEIYHSIGSRSSFSSLRLFSWIFDMSSNLGGKEGVVPQFLDRTSITIFVFKERVGVVSWAELEKVRKCCRANGIHILIFFPTNPPENLKTYQAASDWAMLLKRQDDLTMIMKEDDSKSLISLSKYQDRKSLQIIVVEQLNDAIADILMHALSYREILPQVPCSAMYNEDLTYDQKPVLYQIIELEEILLDKFLLTPCARADFREAKIPIDADYAVKLDILQCMIGNHLTMGAFLCFAPYRLFFGSFDSCSLHVVRYRGTSKGSTRPDMILMHDNLINLFQKGMDWLSTSARLGIQGWIGAIDRDDLEIPEIALKEALANAFVHRDYQDTVCRNQPTRIEVYDDRVEITSYGALSGSLTEEILNKSSGEGLFFRRNPVIAHIFSFFFSLTHNTSGIACMRRAMQEALLLPPMIKVHNVAVVVRFQRPVRIGSRDGLAVELRMRSLVSCSISGLKSLKKVVFSACIDSGFYPVMIEHYPTDVTNIKALLKTMVTKANIYIGIIIRKDSYVPIGQEKSIVELEYLAAKSSGIPCVLFVIEQDIIDDFSETNIISAIQLKFIEQVILESSVIHIRTIDELKRRLLNALKRIGNVTDEERAVYAERYQAVLLQQLGFINLSGSSAFQSISVELSNTFVPLRISDIWRSETRYHTEDVAYVVSQSERIRTPDEVLSLVFQNHRLLLVVGDPGSGKTTLLKHYALSCFYNNGYKALGFDEPVMAFYIHLRNLGKTDTGFVSLQTALSVWSEKHFLEIPETEFFNWLYNDSTLVLLDGLDEIGDVKDRIAICNWIDRAVCSFTKAHFVVTTRSTGYRKRDGIQLESSYVRVDIMDFTKEQQAQFLHQWFNVALLRELPPSTVTLQEWQAIQEEKAFQKANSIIALLDQNQNKGLQLLVGIPLLLQLMAVLWKDREYLPGSRVELYDAALNYLLDFRDRRRQIFPLLAAKDARTVLSSISLWMQVELKKDEVNRFVLQNKMQKVLDTLHNAPSAEQFCNNLVDRAGLLVEYGNSEYIFFHKSFREYMTGVQLRDDRPYRRISMLVNNFGDDWWQEPLRFFISLVDAEVFNAFMQQLFDSSVTEILTQKQQDLLAIIIQEAPQKKISALKNKLLDISTTGNRQLYIMDCLKNIGTQESFDAVVQFSEISIAKDPNILQRAYQITGNKDRSDNINFINRSAAISDVIVDKLGAQYILIKGGQFFFSLTGQLEIVSDFYFAKYTVINELYRQFISYLRSNDSSFAEELPLETYTNTLQALACGIKGFYNYLQREQSLETRFSLDNNRQFIRDNHPVIDPSWYAAKAYCIWLSLLESSGRYTELYRLPTEIEWEYAAGGKNYRTYPWGMEEPSLTRANYDANEGTLTPVGRYCDGVTPEGLYDMAGNVWEWMENRYNKDEDVFALRGGSWSSPPADLRCVARNFSHPVVGLINIGFRVVRCSDFSF